MTKYMRKTFSVAVGSKDYRDGWDRIFGKKKHQYVVLFEPANDPDGVTDWWRFTVPEIPEINILALTFVTGREEAIREIRERLELDEDPDVFVTVRETMEEP